MVNSNEKSIGYYEYGDRIKLGLNPTYPFDTKISQLKIHEKNIFEQALLLKDQRARFWEKHHIIPSDYDLIWWGLEA
jgi:hypothetical protein